MFDIHEPSPAPRGAPARTTQRFELAGLDRNIGLQLGIAHSLTVLKLDPKLKPLGLTAKQVTILWLVQANPDITQAEIARFLEIERSTIHQFTKSLVRNGLLETVPNPRNRRSSLMHITPAGKETLARAREVVAQHEVEASARLTSIERRLLLELLTKLRLGDAAG